MNKALYLLLLIVVVASVLCVGDGVEAGSFVRDGIGARSFGIGGAFVSVADDVSATIWNPAGLALLDGISTGAMHTDRFGAGISFQSLEASVKLSDIGLGFTVVRSSIDDIPFTGEQEGGFFSEAQTLFVGSAGYDLGAALAIQTGPVSALLVGGNLKYYTHTLLEGKGEGIGLDISFLVSSVFDWGTAHFGVTALDVGETKIRWTGTDHNPVNTVPWINRIGVSLELFDSSFRLASGVDVAITRPNLNRLHLGAEYWIVEQLAVRGGLTLAAHGFMQASAGASVSMHGGSIDYAYVPHGTLGESHVLSAQFNFAGWWGEQGNPIDLINENN